MSRTPRPRFPTRPDYFSPLFQSLPIPLADVNTAAVLLAQGIVTIHQMCMRSDYVLRPNAAIPSSMQAAQNRIGRLYVMEGKEDRAADLHGILARCKLPFNDSEWGLDVFANASWEYNDTLLIHPALRVPTSDCMALAHMPGGFGENQVLEHQSFSQLRQIVSKTSRTAPDAYTLIRELIARRSLIRENELANYLEDNDLSLVLREVREYFFEKVPESWLINGCAHRCAYCGTLMRSHSNRLRFPDGACPIYQCAGTNSPSVSERLNPDDGAVLLVARPHILEYWTAPGIDELAIYDAARELGIPATLYPELDSADVGLYGYDIGIDEKSYSSPILLALTLNNSIGGLAKFRRKIVAVSDSSTRGSNNFLARLRAAIHKESAAAQVEFMSVSDLIHQLGTMRHG